MPRIGCFGGCSRRALRPITEIAVDNNATGRGRHDNRPIMSLNRNERHRDDTDREQHTQFVLSRVSYLGENTDNHDLKWPL